MVFDASRVRTILHYSQFYFVTIATTLSTGTLGLPITLADSGFLPFLIPITAAYITHVLIFLFFTEVLQKAYSRNVEKLQESDKDTVPIQIESHELPTYGSQNNLIAKRAYNGETLKRCLPNLHSLGEIYLPHILSQLSTLLIFAALVVSLIGNTLAGSQQFAELFQVSFYQAVSVVSWTLILIIIVFDSVIIPIVSILTIFQGTLFTTNIILTMVASFQTKIPVTNDFSATGDSFLMSLVAFCGFVSTLPLLFSQVKQTRNGMIGFNIAIFLGLTTGFILDILWCWSVLRIVPQHSVCLSNSSTKEIHMVLSLFDGSRGECVKSPSLENSAENGEISSVPLTIILQNEQYPSAPYVSTSIQVFVAMSVSVAFITLGSVLFHTLGGLINSLWTAESEPHTEHENISKLVTVGITRRGFLSLIIFTLIYAIVISNPKSFKVVIEQVGSLILSIELGILFAIMIYKATYSSEFRSYKIPFELPRWFVPFQFLIPPFYICAIIYDIYITIVLSTSQ